MGSVDRRFSPDAVWGHAIEGASEIRAQAKALVRRMLRLAGLRQRIAFGSLVIRIELTALPSTRRAIALRSHLGRDGIYLAVGVVNSILMNGEITK